MTNNDQPGFTLLELMVTLIVLGIIMSIAVPSYQYYITRAKRNQAKHHLEAIALSLERYHHDHQSYKNASFDKLNLKSTDESGNTYQLNHLTKDHFHLRATLPEDSSCHVMSLNDRNQKTATSNSNQNTTDTCW